MLLMFHVSLLFVAMLLTVHHVLFTSAIALLLIRCCSYLLHTTHCLVHVAHASGVAYVCANVPTALYELHISAIKMLTAHQQLPLMLTIIMLHSTYGLLIVAVLLMTGHILFMCH